MNDAVSPCVGGPSAGVRTVSAPGASPGQLPLSFAARFKDPHRSRLYCRALERLVMGLRAELLAIRGPRFEGLDLDVRGW